MYVMQIIRHWAVGVLLLLNSVATFFKPGLRGIDVFFSHRKSTSKHVKQCWLIEIIPFLIDSNYTFLIDWNYTVIRGIKCFVW